MLARLILDRIGDAEPAGKLAVDGDVDHGLAGTGPVCGRLGYGDLLAQHELLIAGGDVLAFDDAARRLCRGRMKFLDVGKLESAFCAAGQNAAASGCSLPRSRLAASRSSRPREARREGSTLVSSRLPFGERAGLVDDQRVDLFQSLEGFGVLDQHAGLGAAAGADHDRHGRGQAQGAGAGDDQHGDGVDQGVGQARLRAEQEPRGKCQGGDRRPRAGTNQAETRSASRWMGARLRWAWPTICTIRASSVSEPTRSARMTNDPVPLMVAPMTLLVARLFDGDRFAGDHRFVDGAAAVEDDAIDGDFFSGTHAQAVAGFHLFERNIFFGRRRRSSRRAVFGLRSSSARMAALVRLRARSSITWPSRTSVVIAAAASK